MNRIDSIQLNSEQMANYRVEGKGNINYKTMQFSPEDIIERRAWMRRALQDTLFRNSDNQRLDGIRVWKDSVFNGLFVEDENGCEFYIPSTKISAQIMNYRRERARIPKEYEGMTGKDFKWDIYGKDMTMAMNTVNQYLLRFQEFSDKGMGLYIYSKEKGSGKTMLSCCILSEISKRYVGSVKFINVIDFLEMTKKGFNYDNPEIEALYICKTLVIDDIGAQMDKEWINTVLYRLINDRYNNHKVTIYTSNAEVDKLNMDSRIIDRIDSRSFTVDLPEVSIRRMLSKAEKDKMMKQEG